MKNVLHQKNFASNDAFCPFGLSDTVERRLEGIFLSTDLNAISDVVSEIDDSVGDEPDFDEVFADAVIPEEEPGSGRRAELKPDVAGLTTIKCGKRQTSA